MRRHPPTLVLLIALMAALLACSAVTGRPGLPPGTVSCQPYGSTPAPIPFAVQLGPVSSAAAEATAIALFRQCSAGAGTISELTSTSAPGTGAADGPNAGQPVWVVNVSATLTEPAQGASYRSHVWIEVNQATGVPVMMGYG